MQASGPQGRAAETPRWHELAKKSRLPCSLPAWLNKETYIPGFSRYWLGARPIIMSALSVLLPTPRSARAGARTPEALGSVLGELVRIDQDT
jgi:hypothetical protein